MRMMKTAGVFAASLVAASVLGASYFGSSARAQSSSSYAYCLMTGPGQECAYNSMAQCMASRRGNADFCEPNNTYTGAMNSRNSRMPQS